MNKATTKKQKDLGKRSGLAKTPSKITGIQDPSLVGKTLLECIQAGDLNAFRDILTSHIMRSNKVLLAKKSGLGRQTLYDLIDPKRDFNPALATVAAVMRGLAK
jgi:DNA-binding phage protein